MLLLSLQPPSRPATVPDWAKSISVDVFGQGSRRLGNGIARGRISLCSQLLRLNMCITQVSAVEACLSGVSISRGAVATSRHVIFSEPHDPPTSQLFRDVWSPMVLHAICGRSQSELSNEMSDLYERSTRSYSREKTFGNQSPGAHS